MLDKCNIGRNFFEFWCNIVCFNERLVYFFLINRGNFIYIVLNDFYNLLNYIIKWV